VAYQLSEHDSVMVLERESQPGYHSTGRSAAMFMETYGTPHIQALTRASRDFYEDPPAGFTDHPILTPRGVLYIATHDQHAMLQQTYEALHAQNDTVTLLTADEALARVPCLVAADLCGAIAEPDARDIDVHALHQGYLRVARSRGAQLRTSTELVSAQYTNGIWTLGFADGGSVRARAVVNAAGAWADRVADICGAASTGLQPCRRTAFTFAAPEGVDVSHWPTVAGIDEGYYFKPDAGQMLGSPANADPVEPHDVVPEELDVATGIYRIEEATTLRIRRPKHSWAGLRSFVSDGDFVVGWDEHVPGFFWLAAQGGYGIQTAAANSLLAATLLRGDPLPQELIDHGVNASTVDPKRLR
jgi:D-arginine dehydrogenase